MTTSHTPGRLKLGRHGAIMGGPEFEFVNGSGVNQLAMTCVVPEGVDGSQEANARRLVACWNACEDLATETLEKEPQMKNWVAVYLERTRQRNELLVAAQSTIANNLHLADGDNCTLIDLKRAVERITGVEA